MVSPLRYLGNNKRLIVSIFFLGYLLIGLIIFKDYGVHWDEMDNREFGKRWCVYLRDFRFKNLTPNPPPGTDDFIRGAFFESSLFAIEKGVLKLKDSRDIIFMRHLCTFLSFYIGVFFFYLLGSLLFKNWKIGLLGSLFLILHPRIFAHSFYNYADIPFLSLYIVGTYTLVIFLRKKTLPRAIFHAIACAMLTGIRMAGIIIPLCSFILIVADLLRSRRDADERSRIIKSLSLYLFVFIIATFILSPVLWDNPVKNFFLFLKFSKYNTPEAGSLHPAWDYNPKWIIITTPLLYCCYFFIGLFASIVSLFRKQEKQFFRNESILIIVLFFLPLILPVIFKTFLYDEWRHHYFIYPIFLIISLKGLLSIHSFLKAVFHGLKYKFANSIYISLIVFGFVNAAYFIFKYHPHQYIYSNVLSGKYMDRAKVESSLDYWGLSYRKALEYILKHDNSEFINIYVPNKPGLLNALILSPQDRKRLIYVPQNDAKYIITNFRGGKAGYSQLINKNEFYSLKIGDIKFMVVYKPK